MWTLRLKQDVLEVILELSRQARAMLIWGDVSGPDR
jgi:hypothetical protein